MRRFTIAALTGFALVVWGCSVGNLVDTDQVTDEDVTFVAQSSADETNNLAADLQDPGSPVVQRYYTGGFFVFSNEGSGSDFYVVLDTVSDTIRLTCISHSNDGRMDNDHDMVYDHDTITFQCQNESMIVNRNGMLYGVEFTLMGQLIHQDNDDNDRGTLRVEWGGIGGGLFEKMVLITDMMTGDTLEHIDHSTGGMIEFSRTDSGINFSKQKTIQDDDGRSLEINISGTIYTQDWEPGDEITADMEVAFNGSGTATTASGREIEVNMTTSPTVTVGVCDGSDRVGIKGGTLTEELYVGNILVRTVTIQFNSDCSYDISNQ